MPRIIEDEPPLHLHKFYPKRQVFRSRSHLFIGESGTGKTTLVKDALFNMPYLDYGLAICPTHSSYMDFCGVLPKAVVWEGTDLSPLVRLVETQKRILKEPGNKKVRYLFVVLDDCIADAKVMKHPVIKDLLYNGRHYLITVLFTTQYIMEVPKKVRKNVKYVYQLKDNTREGIDDLHKCFFGVVGSRARFKQVLTVNTEKRGCLILDKVTSSNDPSKCVFYYRANPRLPDFRIGCKSMWRNCARFATSRASVETAGRNMVNEVMHGMGMRGPADVIEEEEEEEETVDPAQRHTSLVLEDLGPPDALRVA